MAADEIELTVAQYDVRFSELNSTGADRFGFPALERDPGLEAFLNEVIMRGFAVFYDAHMREGAREARRRRLIRALNCSSCAQARN
jgi:hypothetical protein